MILKLPVTGKYFPVPNVLTGFGMAQSNLDAMNLINLIPAPVKAFETPARFSGGGNTIPFAGPRKIWSDTTGAGRYWMLDRDSEGNVVRYQPPKSVTDPIRSILGPKMTQSALSVYAQYANFLTTIPALGVVEMSRTEAMHISFAPGFSPQIPLFMSDDHQGPWMYFFAETFGDDANAGEVYACDYQAFVAANPLDYTAPYKPPATGIPTKTATQKAADIDQIAGVVAAQAPKAAKWDMIAAILIGGAK